MPESHWTHNPQADVVCPSDIVFGLTRHTTDDGNRRDELRPGPASHGLDGLPAPGVLFLLADTVVGGPCVRIVHPTEVIVTSSLHIELFSRPFAEHPVVAGFGGQPSRYQGGAVSASIVRSGDLDVASVSGRFAVLPNSERAAGAIGDLAPPADFDFEQFNGSVLHTLGGRVLGRTADTLTMSFLAHPELANERLGLHGGCAALMGERACDDLIRSVAADGYDVQAVTMNAVFFRPIPADGGELKCIATVQHSGRQLIAAQAVMYTQSGKPAIVVDVIAGGVVGAPQAEPARP